MPNYSSLLAVINKMGQFDMYETWKSRKFNEKSDYMLQN